MSNSYTQFKGNNPFGTQAKMLFHADRIAEYIQTGDTHPVFCEINLTSRCNLNCVWCISENFRRNESIQFNKLTKFLQEFKNFGGKAVTMSGGGEPTLYKYFENVVNYAYHLGLDLGLMTNGVYNNKLNLSIGKLFKWARFSLDTVNKQKYKEWKGTDQIDTVLNNIKSLQTYPVKVGINCNINNKYTIDDIKQLIDTTYYYCDYIQFRPILPRQFKKEKIDFNHDVWDYLRKLPPDTKINLSNDKVDDLLYQVQHTYKSCEGHFFSFILDSNGDVCVCMYHPKDNRFVFGNIYHNTFKEIWKSEQRKNVIRFMREVLNMDITCQQCCKLHEINKLLDFINTQRTKMDINFL